MVWSAITDPDCIKQWMLDSELEIISDWQVHSPIVFRGELNGYRFENRGTIRAFEPEKIFAYDYWSTLSQGRVPEGPENTTWIRFEIEATVGGTKVTVTLANFADQSIYRHVKFYWNGTLPVLKRFCEERGGIQGSSV